MKTTRYIRTLHFAAPLLIAALSMLPTTRAHAQGLGINNTATGANASAILDLNTGNSFGSPNGKGILIPNVQLTGTADNTTIASPPTSLLIYNIASAGAGSTAVYKGYYYNAGTSASPSWVAFLDQTPPNAGWMITGNYGTTAGTHYIGTNDAQDVVFKRNSSEVMRLYSASNYVGIGTAAPSYLLDVNGTARVTNAYLNNTNTFLSQGAGNALRVTTNSGYVDYGPQNTGWAHFTTDRSQYYFDHQVGVNGSCFPYTDNGSSLGISGTNRWSTLYIGPKNSNFSNDQGGNIELGADNSTANTGSATPYIDFHFGTGAAQDYNTRIINDATGRLNLIGTIRINSAYNFPTADGTNGQVLTTNGGGAVSWAAASGGITGSCGSGANYVPKMSSTTAITCSQIYDDATNVGIGFGGAGSYKLDVNGTGRATKLIISGAQDATGNLQFSAANPYITAASYVIMPGGLYCNSGTHYDQSQYQCRGGIHNDGAAYLQIDGGTSNNTYIPGAVGIGAGTSTPSYQLDVRTSSTVGGYVAVSGSTTANAATFGVFGSSASTYTNLGAGVIGWNTSTGLGVGGSNSSITIPILAGGVGGSFICSGTGATIQTNNAASYYGLIVTSGGAYNGGSSYWQGSDRRFKKGITTIANGTIEKIMKLNPCEYYYDVEKYPSFRGNEEKKAGLIAQELEEVFPESVTNKKYIADPTVDITRLSSDKKTAAVPMVSGYYAVDYTSLIPYLIKGIQEQQKMITDLQKEVKDLKAQGNH